ncbi:tetratricopeptide repeat protein [Schlesneria paludicola]|uniref:tetratricopeptide repeat protein n=1 Tax=Schlesneria paludicola TaxID=360056 RepID=UPI00029AC50E|nr:tetratricopeptide repeat protein [Schlesneria paludicola]
MLPDPNGAIANTITTIRNRTPVLTPRSIRLGVVAVLICPLVTGCQSLQKRLSQDSAKCGALCAQAREARERGNAEQANQYLDEALRQKPTDVETRRQLAETMWNSGRRHEAVEEFAALHNQLPKDTRLAARLAVMQWETNRRTEAAETAESVLKLDQKSKEAWLVRARCQVVREEFEEAMSSYIQLAQLAPDDVIPMIELAELHLKRGHPDRACPLFRAASQHSATTPEQQSEIEWLLGISYTRSQRWSLAVPVLERAIGRRKASAEDWCFLGWARLQSGDVTGAQSDLQRAVHCDPNSASVRSLANQLEASTESMTAQRRVTPAGHHDLD